MNKFVELYFVCSVICVHGICSGRGSVVFRLLLFAGEMKSQNYQALNQSTRTSVDLSQRFGMFRLRMAWVLGGHYTSLSHPVCLVELMVFYKLCHAGVDFVSNMQIEISFGVIEFRS